ncbi:hypothetical protein BJ138DRAFT_1198530 [Hygrophoropsis aurantiaca]|uniref:Uncharacterized protein n=1 Tax=Hygrophoropsis aurantiaca TaxID=72124 RepID=A0ACB7ZPM2_9AGAM|nr:hypothetical protein BJ138DRAFT_1198530 [Hygrophoropsis aurantiaca]
MSQLYNFANFAFNNPPPPPSDLDAYLDHLWLATLYLPGLSSLTLSPSETTVFKNGLQTIQRWLDRLPDAALPQFAEWLSPAARARLNAPAPPLSFGAVSLLAPVSTTASPERDKAALVIYQPPLLRESTPLFLKADAEGEESWTADGIAEMEDVDLSGARAVTPVRTVVVKTEPLDCPTSAQVEEEEVDELGSFLASPSPPAPKVATRITSKAASKATPKAPPPLRSAATIRASVAFVMDHPGREVRPPIVKEEETGELGELKGAPTALEFGAYARKYRAISDYLVGKEVMSRSDQRKELLRGLPEDMSKAARIALRSRYPDVDRDLFYPLQDIGKIVLEILQHPAEYDVSTPRSTATSVSTQPSTSASDNTMTQEPAIKKEDFDMMLATMMSLTREVVRLKENPDGNRSGYGMGPRPPSICNFCGQAGHFMRECPVCAGMIAAGKCHRDQMGRIVLPSGAQVSRELAGNNFAERIEEYHRLNPNQHARGQLMFSIQNPIPTPPSVSTYAANYTALPEQDGFPPGGLETKLAAALLELLDGHCGAFEAVLGLTVDSRERQKPRDIRFMPLSC